MEYKVVETPITKTKIELKPWITGAEAEYINSPMFDSLDSGAISAQKPEVKIKSEIINSVNHRLLEKFVISLNGDKEDILNKVLNLPEQDTEFIYNEIAELRKKK